MFFLRFKFQSQCAGVIDFLSVGKGMNVFGSTRTTELVQNYNMIYIMHACAFSTGVPERSEKVS